MNNQSLTLEIKNRINELKSEQIGLKMFIQSDQCLWEGFERAIKELTWVLERLEAKEV